MMKGTPEHGTEVKGREEAPLLLLQQLRLLSLTHFLLCTTITSPTFFEFNLSISKKSNTFMERFFFLPSIPTFICFIIMMNDKNSFFVDNGAKNSFCVSRKTVKRSINRYTVEMKIMHIFFYW